MLTAQSTFATPRLKLSPLEFSHDEFIFSLVNTAGWIRFIGDRNIRTTADAGAYIEKISQNTNIVYWVVALSSDQTPVGIVTFIKRDYLEFPDIGFAFLPAHTNAGYAFEAASVVLQCLISQRSYDSVLATTVPDNVDSIRLLMKLGFTFRNEIEVEKEKLQVYGRSLCYSNLSC